MVRSRTTQTSTRAPGKPGERQERIAVTGIGFVCPVGATAWEAALSLRKNRASFLQHETVMVADDRFGTVLRGATVSRMSPDFAPPRLDGPERAALLALPAIRECLTGVPDAVLTKAFVRFDNLLEPDHPAFREQLQAAVPGLPSQDSLGKKGSERTAPRCAFLEGVIRACERLATGPEQVAVVGCVDSNATATRLEELLYAGRLMDAANPEGIIAGEAAGAVLLETESHARKRNAPIHAFIASWGRGTEPNPWTGSRPSIARGLTDAFHEALSNLDDDGEGIGRVVSDLNGERPRAMEWALAAGRVFIGCERERYLSIPLFTLGDCGGAAGAALLVGALSAFALHRRSPRLVAMTTSDDDGSRRVICLERGDLPDRRMLMDDLRKRLNMEKHASQHDPQPSG